MGAESRLAHCVKPLLCLAESQACSSLPVCVFPSTSSSRQSQLCLYTQCPYSIFGPPFHLILLFRVSSVKGLHPPHFNSLTLITSLCCSKELSCIKHLLTQTLPLVSQQTINVSLNPLILRLPSVCHIQTISYSLLSAGPTLRVRLTQLTEELIFVILLRYHSLLHDPSSCLTP